MLSNRSTFITLVLLVLCLAGLFAGCSSDEPAEQTTPDPASLSDSAKIAMMQATMTEAITRWRYGDKSVLYENEFPYMRQRLTYDEYLQVPQIANVRADTIMALNILDADILEDSAWVDVEVIIVNSLGDTNKLYDRYPMYYYADRWIRPTLSGWHQQMEFDDIRRRADSAAQAEQDEEW